MTPAELFSNLRHVIVVNRLTHLYEPAEVLQQARELSMQSPEAYAADLADTKIYLRPLAAMLRQAGQRYRLYDPHCRIEGAWARVNDRAVRLDGWQVCELDDVADKNRRYGALLPEDPTRWWSVYKRWPHRFRRRTLAMDAIDKAFPFPGIAPVPQPQESP